MRIRGGLILILFLISQAAQAQQETVPDFMRSIGKIYVVAGVTLIILLTLLIFMIILDRKISLLEKRQKK